MYVIPRVIEEEDCVKVPLYGTSEYVHIEWKEDESPDQILIRSYGDKECSSPMIWSRFKICPSDLDVNGEHEYELMEVTVYEIRGMHHDTKFYLISCGDIEEFDDIFHCVCLPFNRLNLFKFFSEYLCPMAAVKFRS